MKKILLGLGTIAAVAAPVAAVVACSSDNGEKDFIQIDNDLIYKANIARVELHPANKSTYEHVEIYFNFGESTYYHNKKSYTISIEDFKKKLDAAGWSF